MHCWPWEIGRVGRNQTTVMRICDRWMQEGTTNRRSRSHPSQCITYREDSDERTFEILQNKTQFVRHRDGEKFHSDCVVRTVKHPTKIMIWSVISGKGTRRLDVVKGMMRQDQYKMSCKIA
ncbi:uncharacterized protein TNCV_3479881 [Trichonephila clavipes]|nr:uncharacterized protein TNCV_3479881 [Trichonephila clavipes]